MIGDQDGRRNQRRPSCFFAAYPALRQNQARFGSVGLSLLMRSKRPSQVKEDIRTGQMTRAPITAVWDLPCLKRAQQDRCTNVPQCRKEAGYAVPRQRFENRYVQFTSSFFSPGFWRSQSSPSLGAGCSLPCNASGIGRRHRLRVPPLRFLLPVALIALARCFRADSLMVRRPTCNEARAIRVKLLQYAMNNDCQMRIFA